MAAEANKRMEELLHGDLRWLGETTATPALHVVIGGISNDDEEAQLDSLREWMEAQGLLPGEMSFDFADPDTGEQRAVSDLAWPNGVQEGLSEPVAVLLNEASELFAIANQAGYRCFTSTADFKEYVNAEILAVDEAV